MRSADVTERSNAKSQQVGSLPESVAIDEFRPGGIFHRRVSAGDAVAGFLEFGERIRDPTPLDFPIRNGGDQFTISLHALVDSRVVWDLHLVDGDAIGGQVDGFADT